MENLKFAAQQRGTARTLIRVAPDSGLGTTPRHWNDEPAARSTGAPNGRAEGDNRWRFAPASPAVSATAPRADAPAPGAVNLVVQQGQTVFTPDAGAGLVYVVQSGCIGLFKSLPGRRSICLGLLGPKDVFNQETTGEGGGSGVSAEALTDSSITVIEADRLPSVLAGSPELAASLVASLTARLTGVQTLIEHLLSRDIMLRLAAMLLNLGNRFGQAAADGLVTIAIPVPHKMLARMIGANRVTVTRVLSDLRAEGMVVSLGRNKLAVVPAKLREYVSR